MAETVVRLEEKTKQILQNTNDQLEKVGDLLKEINATLQAEIKRGTVTETAP